MSESQQHADPPASRNRGTWLLTWLILAGLVLGAIIGQMLHDPAFDPATMTEDEHRHAWALELMSFIGADVFMGLLKMLIMPLIIASVIVGVSSVGDVRKLGRVGALTLGYYFGTMLLAVTIGLVLVLTIAPGEGVDLGEVYAEPAERAYGEREERLTDLSERGLTWALMDIVRRTIPDNPLAAAADPTLGNILAVIFFSILFAGTLTTLGERGKVVVQFFEIVFTVMMKLVHVVIWLAPVGVLCLLGLAVARIGLGVLADALGWYMATVLIGLAVHAFVVLPLLLWLIGGVRPFRYLHQVRAAVATALATSSSSATLPVTMEAAVEEGRCSRQASGLVLPLGATINMDGTALYEAVSVVFLAQLFGVALGLDVAIVIALTATLAAVGAAGIPEAGLVTMVIVIAAVNDVVTPPGAEPLIPLAAVGIVVGVDRILDMCRTAVNVWGDAAGARIITRFAPDPPTDPANATDTPANTEPESATP